MAVGNQATPVTVNANLTNFAIELRNLMRNIANQQAFVVGLGLAGLQALGFSAADAQLVLTDFSYLNTIAGVYFGTAIQATTFNFDNQLSGLWAGQ